MSEPISCERTAPHLPHQLDSGATCIGVASDPERPVRAARGLIAARARLAVGRAIAGQERAS
jgi:hypothetical protein